MDIQEFSKPTKWKIFLAIIIFLVMPGPYFGACPSAIGAGCQTLTILFGVWFLIEARYINNPYGLLMIILIAVILFIIAYTLSCLIVKVIIWIYDKRKKK